MRDVARDFCAIHFGPEAADGLAGIYLRSAAAYKYGLHIEPISYGQFNSFLHMRVNVFPAEGYPAIDNGKGHLAFLRRVYLQCDPWRAETVRSLEQGLDTARGMSDAYAAVKPLVKDADVAADLEDRLHMTCRLIDTNINYVKTMFAYFDYMDTASEEHRDVLAGAVDAFEAARTAFVITPGFGYQLFGVDVLLKNARSALADIDAARQRLESTPDKGELETLIAGQQQRYGEVLASQAGTAVRCAHFEVLVDSQDCSVAGGVRLVPLRWDRARSLWAGCSSRRAGHVTVLPKTWIQACILSCGTAGPQNDYTARIYWTMSPADSWMGTLLSACYRPGVGPIRRPGYLITSSRRHPLVTSRYRLKLYHVALGESEQEKRLFVITGVIAVLLIFAAVGMVAWRVRLLRDESRGSVFDSDGVRITITWPEPAFPSCSCTGWASTGT